MHGGYRLMPYTRPVDLDTPSYVVHAAPMLLGEESFITLTITMFERRTFAIAYYVPPEWTTRVHHESPELLNTPSSTLHTPVGTENVIEAGESDYTLYNVTIDPEDASSSMSAFFLDPEFPLSLEGQPRYPQPAQLRLGPGTMEVFEVIYGTGGPGDGDPGEIIDCDPVPRPPWPYVDPYLVAASGPPGIVRRNRR